MCGILGSINFKFDQEILDLIKHRGPDDSGILTINEGNRSIRLAQRRLSILDLSVAGHQPMVSPCGKYALIFNGEIYNHLELRKTLPAETKFRGHCDTETVLYYLMTNGISSIDKLNGIFSLGFLDINQRILHIARDPFGVKPLYYHESEGSVIFSSEIRPLLAMISSSNLNKQALATLLRLRYNPSPETLYNEIEKVRPGHVRSYNLATVTADSKCYIHKSPPKLTVTLEKAVEEYSEKIEAAVTRQLLSDVEIGIFLSGGIDSSVVAALAKKNYKGRLKAFTVGFDGDYEEDEIQAAAETASLLNLEHSYRKISFTDFLGQIEECTNIVEEPLATTSIIPMYFLAQLASQHVKVVLTGQGADEPLGGYTKYKLELLRRLIPRPVRGLILPTFRLAGVRNETMIRGANALNIDGEVARFLGAFEIFSEQEIKNLIGIQDSLSLKRVKYFYDILEFNKGMTATERMMSLDTRLNLADDLLNYTDKLTMHFSMECRVPMLDLELVEYIESLPRKYKLNLTEGKRIHKIFSRRLLPEEIINRKKRGFQSPTRKWFIKESEVIKSILLQQGTNFSRVFNQSYVAELIDQHNRGFNKEKQIFLLITICYWLARK